MIIPFSQPLGPTNGPDSDGCVFSRLDYKKPIAAYTSTVISPAPRVFRGNASLDGDGTVVISYKNITDALSAVGGGAETLFDATLPTDDEIWIEVLATETVNGFCFYLKTAGVYTGTAACTVKYRGASGWVDVACILSDQFRTVGMKYINFGASLSGASVILSDALVNQTTEPQLRRVLIKFTGISAVTTAPVFDRAARLFPASARTLTNTTDSLVDNLADMPAVYDTLEILPMVGDRSMFCFSSPFVKIKVSLERARISANAKVIYSKGSNQYGDVTFLEMLSDSVARPNQWLSIGPTAPATSITVLDTISPPADWAEQTVNLEGTDYTGHWFGLEYTADDTIPVLVMLMAFKAGGWLGDAVVGHVADEAVSATKFSAHTRKSVSADATFFLGHPKSKTRAVLILPAGSTSAEVAFAASIAKGDKLVPQQLTGSETDVPADGHFMLL